MTDRPIYLDHNATTPLDPEVLETMLPWLRDAFGNPSSDHPYGRAARAAVDRARAQVAEAVGAAPDEVVFTSGGTEADHLALLGAAPGCRARSVAFSAVEHPAVVAPATALGQEGWALHRLPVDADGRVDPEVDLPEPLGLLSVMLANNETGAVQPVAALADRARRAGAVVHTDAAQAVGRVPVALDALGVDLITIAGHKLHGPKGVGALIVRRGTPLRPLTRGGGQEGGRRAGTENVAGIVGLGEACRVANDRLEVESARQAALRDRLGAALGAGIPGLRITGLGGPRLPNTLHVRLPGARGSEVLAACPEVAASTGSACHAGEEHASGVLLAMGWSPTEALGALRLSVGRGTTAADIDAAAGALIRAVARVTGAR